MDICVLYVYMHCGGTAIMKEEKKRNTQHIEEPWGMKEHWLFKDKAEDLKARQQSKGIIKNACLYPKNNKMSLKYCKQSIDTFRFALSKYHYSDCNMGNEQKGEKTV